MYRVLGRRSNLAAAGLAVVLAISAFFRGVPAAQAQAEGSNMVSLDVVDADLSQVVMMLMRESKQSIIIADPDIKPKKVSALLDNLPLETVLNHIVKSAGCTLTKGDDGVFIIGKAAPAPAACEARPVRPDTGNRAARPGSRRSNSTTPAPST